LNEPEFIARLQQGDETAFSQLVDGWKDRVFNTALGLIQHHEDAEDITQEVFISVWKSIDEYRADAGIGTWLYRITVSRSLDLIRKKKARKRFAFLKLIWRSEPELEEIPDFIHPGVQLERKQDAAALFAAVRKLPDQQRIAYSLQKVEGLPYTEIALILETTVPAVESLLQRAKQNLRKSLATYYGKNK
jgi:RNA polymerase sigma-70 factor (ECF subfamily)